MDILRNHIPQMDVIQMERVFNQVFFLDINKSLIMYEAEYNVLQEEMLSGSLPGSANVSFESRTNKSPQKAPIEAVPSAPDQSGLIKELEAQNKQLKSENMELQDQLHVSRSHIHDLESSIDSYKSSIKRLEDRVRAIEEERLALYDSLTLLRSRNVKEWFVYEYGVDWKLRQKTWQAHWLVTKMIQLYIWWYKSRCLLG